MESVLCSRQTIRILKLLKQMGRLNVSEIAKHLGINYASTLTRLEALETEGILRHVEFGRARLYYFRDSPRTKAVTCLLEAWET